MIQDISLEILAKAPKDKLPDVSLWDIHSLHEKMKGSLRFSGQSYDAFLGKVTPQT